MIFGSQMSYGVMSLWKIFQSCVNWVECLFGQMSNSLYFWPLVFSAICPFGQMSFGHTSILSFVFRSYVHSVKCLSPDVFSVIYLSVICPFGHLPFGNLSYHRLTYQKLYFILSCVDKFYIKGNCLHYQRCSTYQVSFLFCTPRISCLERKCSTVLYKFGLYKFINTLLYLTYCL